MSTTPSHPAVYVEEIPARPRDIDAAPTAITAFVGRAGEGDAFRVSTCHRHGDFLEAFPAPDAGFATQVSQFFLNGGSRCHVVNLPAADPARDVLADYRQGLDALVDSVEMFNLLVLPGLDAAGNLASSVLHDASEFCRRHRAFLLIDAPAEWNSLAAVLDPVSGVETVRTQTVADHAALFHPRLRVGTTSDIGPCGAIAGLIARTDATRGVWKAPAGVEATLAGVDGLVHRWNDADSATLNAGGINLIRVLPAGIVNWNARTLAGADGSVSEYRYVPVRRTALFIEQSLLRGLAWTTFEPNDEPLWAQVRLVVTAFLQGLFRQGAFQGQSPREAYFVRCDAETTTAVDRAQGRLNLQLGFAPLKPAEFVVLSLSLSSDVQWIAPEDNAAPATFPADARIEPQLLVAAQPQARQAAARVVARQSGRGLYRVDLAALQSKYIDETEKNLARIFEAAERSGTVLLLDEADALFGKRSAVRDAHERFANLGVARRGSGQVDASHRASVLFGLRRPPDED